MPRELEKDWPKHGRLQIGFNEESELECIRETLRDLIAAGERTGDFLFDEHLRAWVELGFKAKLGNFRIRDRHPTNGYTTLSRGPMSKRVLVFDVLSDPVRTETVACINHFLSCHEDIGVVCYMGEPAMKAFDFKPASSDKFLKGNNLTVMPDEWVKKGAKNVSVHEEARVSVVRTETAEWKARMAKVPSGKQARQERMSQDPWMPRYDLNVARDPVGWWVDGQGTLPYRDDFTSLEEAEAYAQRCVDDQCATAHAEELQYERDVEFAIWKRGWPQVRNFDLEEAREVAFERFKAEKFAEIAFDRAALLGSGAKAADRPKCTLTFKQRARRDLDAWHEVIRTGHVAAGPSSSVAVENGAVARASAPATPREGPAAVASTPLPERIAAPEEPPDWAKKEADDMLASLKRCESSEDDESDCGEPESEQRSDDESEDGR
jgi:hypothetical protein